MLGSLIFCFVAFYVLKTEFRAVLSRRILQKLRLVTDNFVPTSMYVKETKVRAVRRHAAGQKMKYSTAQDHVCKHACEGVKRPASSGGTPQGKK